MPISDVDPYPIGHFKRVYDFIIKPAVLNAGFQPIRADDVLNTNYIAIDVIKKIINCDMSLCDLSSRNPNVFYELSLRHACKLPTVQIIRAADKIPFDLDQFRTIKIDTTDIYSLVPQLHTYRTEISSQVRKVIEDVDAVDNPISIFFPKLKVSFN